MNKKLTLALVTALSGAISGYALRAATSTSTPLTWLIIYFGPGVIFGLATAIFLKRTSKLSLFRSFLWLIASGGAWYFALRAYFFFSSSEEGPIGMIAAGLVGSTLLALASIFIRQDKVVRLPIIAVAGTAAGAGMWLIINGLGIYPTQSLLGHSSWPAAFALWQILVGLSLVSDPTSWLRKPKP